MSLDSVVQVPTEETVQEYVDIFKNTDLKTALIAAGGLAGGLLLVRLVLKLVEKGLNRTSVPQTMHTMLRTMLRILLDLVVVLTVANYIGIPVTSFVALLGLFGLAVSLALQGVLSNLALTPILDPVLEITEQLRAGEERDYTAAVSQILEKRELLRSLING